MLKIQFKDRRQPAVWLVESVFTLGSGGKNNLIIDDDGVSEVHAEIRKEGDHLYLADLRSFGGTFVNGSRITERFQLRAGDRITLGKVELEIIDPKTAGASPAAGPAAPAVKSEWSLTALGGELKGKSFPLHGIVALGRSNKCDIHINDEYMSRRHAELSIKGGVLRIIDLDSSNGTFVNGQKVAEKALKPGDRIAFDQNIFLVVGPSNVKVVDDDDDAEEATVFRAAPASMAAPAQQESPRVKIPAAEKLRESLAQSDPQPVKSEPAKPAASSTPLIAIIVISVIAMCVMGYFALK